jgi:DNA (cytosine-5)-methyltransferase 1
MKYFSIFSGIGGIELGIQECCNQNSQVYQSTCTNRDTQRPDSESIDDSTKGFSCVGFSEIDKYAIQIYKKHFPTHKNYGDATTIIPREIPDFDLLVGGFPCQAFSIAGKRQGFEDVRGTLFFEIARICKDKRPRYIFLENVKGVLNHEDGKTFLIILKVLTDLGYILQWEVLNSKNFGVPQNRERVFIVGYLGGTSRPEIFPLYQNDTKYNEQRESNEGQEIAWALRSRDYKDRTNFIVSKEIKQLNKPVHSNSRVYSEDEISPSLNSMQGGSRQPFVAMRWERSEKGKESRRKAKQELGKDATPFSDGNRQLTISKENVSGCVTGAINKDCLLGDKTNIDNLKLRKLTPIECERLQGFPDNWTKYGINDIGEEIIISDSQRYKCLGNAVTVNVIKAIMQKFI